MKVQVHIFGFTLRLHDVRIVLNENVKNLKAVSIVKLLLPASYVCMAMYVCTAMHVCMATCVWLCNYRRLNMYGYVLMAKYA